jgi:hypothetical protein
MTLALAPSRPQALNSVLYCRLRLDVNRTGFAGVPFEGWKSLDGGPCGATGAQAGQTKCPPDVFEIAILGSGTEPSGLEMVDRPCEKFFGMVSQTEAVTAPVAHKHDAVNIDIEDRAIHRPA